MSVNRGHTVSLFEFGNKLLVGKEVKYLFVWNEYIDMARAIKYINFFQLVYYIFTDLSLKYILVIKMKYGYCKKPLILGRIIPTQQ